MSKNIIEYAFAMAKKINTLLIEVENLRALWFIRNRTRQFILIDLTPFQAASSHSQDIAVSKSVQSDGIMDPVF